MSWNKLFAKRSTLPKAQTAGFCERLEPRWLLATYTAPPGNMAAYLLEGPLQGQVIVRLNDPENPVIAHTFQETTGQHVVNAGENEDFLFVDQVRPHWKPTAGGGNPEGIKVLSDAGDATLLIDGNLFFGEPPEPYYGLRTYGVTPINSTDTRIDVFDVNTSADGETTMSEGWLRT